MRLLYRYVNEALILLLHYVTQAHNLLMFREAIGQKMENAYIVLYKLDLDIKYIEKQLGYTTSMT